MGLFDEKLIQPLSFLLKTELLPQYQLDGFEYGLVTEEDKQIQCLFINIHNDSKSFNFKTDDPKNNNFQLKVYLSAISDRVTVSESCDYDSCNAYQVMSRNLEGDLGNISHEQYIKLCNQCWTDFLNPKVSSFKMSPNNDFIKAVSGKEIIDLVNCINSILSARNVILGFI